MKTAAEIAEHFDAMAQAHANIGNRQGQMAMIYAAEMMRLHAGVEPDIDALQREAHADGVKQGREETSAWVCRASLSGDMYKPGAPLLVIQMSLERARDAQSGLADMLCWIRGFTAAIPDDHDRHPMGVEEMRSLSIALQDAIAKARKVEPEPVF